MPVATDKLDKSQKTKPKSARSWIGYLFALISAMSSAIGSFFFKTVDENKLVVVMIRSMLQFILFLPAMKFARQELAGENATTNLLLLLRGILSPVIMTMMGFSMNYLTLGDAMAIFYTYPALVGVFAWIILRGIFCVFFK